MVIRALIALAIVCVSVAVHYAEQADAQGRASATPGMSGNEWFLNYTTSKNPYAPPLFSDCVQHAPEAVAAGAGFTPAKFMGPDPITFEGHGGGTNVMLMCIGLARGYYVVLDVVATSARSAEVGNAIISAFNASASAGVQPGGAAGVSGPAMDSNSWFWTTGGSANADANQPPLSDCVQRAPGAVVAGAGFTPAKLMAADPVTFAAHAGGTSVMLMCIGLPGGGYYMVLDVVVAGGPHTSAVVGNAINTAFHGTVPTSSSSVSLGGGSSSSSGGSGSSSSSLGMSGSWQLTSGCDFGGGNWQGTFALTQAASGALTGSVSNDNLGAGEIAILADASGYANTPAMQSKMNGSTMTLVLHPKKWSSVIQLYGLLSGASISGSVHHPGDHDCAF
jgi:hypothetical protein